MAGDMKILLFGDQTSDPREHLRAQLLAGRSNVLLSHFIQQVGVALKNEIAQLAWSERDAIPDFSTIEELADRSLISGVVHPGLTSALLCISQLAKYLESAGTLDQDSHHSSNTLIVGLCTGLFAAAAVASAPAGPRLIPLGVETVLIAFRVGTYVHQIARQLEISPTCTNSWSRVVGGTTESDARTAVAAFHEDKKIPVSKQVYISAVSHSSVTISGPPSTLEQFFKGANAFGTTPYSAPIGGPYHAPHLYLRTDPQHFMPCADAHVSSVLDSHHLSLPLVSSSAGCLVNSSLTTREIFCIIIDDVLSHPLHLDKILDRCVDAARTQLAQRCTIHSLGPSLAGNSLSATLMKQTGIEVTLDQSSVQPPLINGISGSTRGSSKSKIAIVGMAGRFPDAADHDKLWELLEAGLDVHRKIPPDRFDVEKHYDPTGKKRNTSHTPYGCFIDEPGLFDPRFFNMSPREATQTDPMHRLGLVSAYEALEMSGYVPNRTPSTKLDRIGTFYGQTSDDWREINAAQEVDTYFITGGVRAFAPGRINYHFKFSGPSFSVDTACSSSMAAIQLACTSLWARDCDTAVSGGLNVMTNSDIFAGLSRGQFLSKTGNCQTYDNDADGYCRGDGIGTLILKRLEDAEADNDRILGVVVETATNHSANAISITHPHAPTQERLFQKVMNDAGVDPHEVDYVEMHGTGTQAGDGTEMQSVTNVFAPASRKGRRGKSLHLGSVKANVGHGEAVSGVTALIKCLLMLKRNTIPPHCGIKKTINQGFPQDLMARNVHIAFKKTPFTPQDGSPRRIFVNNFSAAGGNTALLLEDAPPVRLPKTDPRSHWVIAVSAKSKTALKANTRRLIQYIDDTPELRIADLSYTTTARRIQYNYRIAFECSTLSEAREVLTSKLDDAIDPIQSVPPTVAFVFTGQGSHYASMGKELFQLNNHFRSDILSFNGIAINQGFPSFLPLIQGDAAVNDLPPIVVQLGLTCIQMALTRLWATWGITPDMVLGHSLGEYAALSAAGVLSPSDVIFLVGERARLVQERCTAGSHAMLATKSSARLIADLIADLQGLSIACINGPQETVLSGTVADIDVAAENLASHGVKSKKLNLDYAFHSSQVDVFLADYENIAKAVCFHAPKVPIISPAQTGVINENIDASYLSHQARATVDFSGCIATAQQLGLINDQTVWLEIGPHPVCSNFIKAEIGASTATFPSLRKDTPIYKTVGSTLSSLHLAGVQVQWSEYHRDFLECLQLLDLPTYAFDNKNYWIQYTGDWNLSKGVAGGHGAIAESPTPTFSTTSIHKVVSEVVDGNKATVVTESDVSRPDLLAAVSGHVVNGTALCPSSLYADMAYTVSDRLYKLLRPDGPSVQMNVCNMEVSKPFIAETTAPKGQMIRLSATMHLTNNKADLVFSSGSGKSIVEHAKCHVEYGSGAAWLAEWQRTAYLIKGRVESLKKAAEAGTAHRMLRGMAYKLFASFVDYDKKYRGMEEVILDSPELEATSHVAFQTSPTDGDFFCSPYWIDSVAHLAGFIVNANDTLDSSKQVYISHGWESMRFAEPLQATKTYRSYVKMQPAGNNMVSGDVYIFDGDKIIGLVGALKFQCIPRQLLNTFLPPRGLAAIKAPLAVNPRLAAKPAAASKPLSIKPSAKPHASSISLREPAPLVTTKALGIIAAELGIPVDELADSIEFANIGVDSLMSLSITGRMREELEIEVQSSLFTDYPTVRGMKGFLSRYDISEAVHELLEETDGSLTPDLDLDDMSSNGGRMSTPTSVGSADLAEPLEVHSDSESLSMIIRETISREMGVEVSELLATDDLSSLGMDSLMSLSILGVLRETTGLSLPATFLIDHHSIKAIEKSLNIGPVVKEPKPKADPPVAKRPEAAKGGKAERLATSVLLQGNSKTATKTFWLVPDGSGSATSYMFLPEISRGVAVWGLNSPFMKTPGEYHGGVSGMASSFITEIKRRQPQGPYSVGGWSAGGIMAYDIVRQLTDVGDRVDDLVLIDSPSPALIEPLPASIHRFFGEIGLLGDGEGALDKLPAWLLPHFAKTVEALSAYKPQRPTLKQRPRVFVIWCEDGVCKYPSDRRPDPYPYGHAQWLLENRTDFGPNHWDEYVDGAEMTCRTMTGNHFTMMRDPCVVRLGELLREALI
ncbi:MAG: hypothetical protein LQ338_002472 [Usnochroma carphineum]|nr:MAG: hypothetical protein LQ338_002472 [Usnochroma carphineum]